MHQVIDVARKNAVKGFGKHQFSVDVPQGPKYDANKLTNWKCQSSKVIIANFL